MHTDTRARTHAEMRVVSTVFVDEVGEQRLSTQTSIIFS